MNDSEILDSLFREAKGDDAGKAYPEIAAYLREKGCQR